MSHPDAGIVAGPSWFAKLVTAKLLVALFVVLLLAVNFVHFQLFTVYVVFYATLLDVAIATVLTALVYVFAFGRRALTGFEGFLVGLICLLGGYAFAITGPTVVDRSLSIYILEKLDQRGGAIQQDAFASVFIDEYLPEHRLVDVRLTEQQSSGTITIEGGCVRLTEWGRSIVGITRFYRTNILPKNRILLGETTDDLTDPFRNSADAPDYACE
ncbi:MAG: hypothetical protein AAGG06_06335 [Pseudomonadota bacterium]